MANRCTLAVLADFVVSDQNAFCKVGRFYTGVFPKKLGSGSVGCHIQAQKTCYVDFGRANGLFD